MEMGIRWFLIKKTFPIWENLGFHITPNHYYEPVPDTRTLTDEIWNQESEMLGVDLQTENQLDILQNECVKYKSEYDTFGLHNPTADNPYYVHNGWFGEVDGDILYTILRSYQPKTVIEIGSGYSTLLMAYTLQKNQQETQNDNKLISIDPYPNKEIKNLFPKNIDLITKKLQSINLDFFNQLQENDILFIDSTSMVKINSDVCYEFLELLPRLNKGVIIHIHDIFLPQEYPKEWVLEKKLFSNEQYLLQAFLMYNHSFKILWAGNYMKNKFPDLFNQMFRGKASQSFWIKKAK